MFADVYECFYGPSWGIQSKTEVFSAKLFAATPDSGFYKLSRRERRMQFTDESLAMTKSPLSDLVKEDWANGPASMKRF